MRLAAAATVAPLGRKREGFTEGGASHWEVVSHQPVTWLEAGQRHPQPQPSLFSTCPAKHRCLKINIFNRKTDSDTSKHNIREYETSA